MKPILTSLFLVLFTFPIMALAVDCNERSQNFLAQGEDYFKSRDLVNYNSNSKRVIDILYKSIAGDWVGNEVITECKGSLRSMKAASQRFNVESTVARGNFNAITLRKVSYRSEGKTKESLDLFNFKNVIYFDDRGEKIYIIEKFYRINSNQSSIVIENLVTLNLGGDRLSITVKSYSNGFFSYLQEIDLVRN